MFKGMNCSWRLLCVVACFLSVSNAFSPANKTATQGLEEVTKSGGGGGGLYQKLQHIAKSANATGDEKNRTTESAAAARPKRQLAFGGGFGFGFGAYDYNDYYGEYHFDYSYDYYEWICTETQCQLCDVLTNECCDPAIDINCYLSDSCMNNPCLSGGTCLSSRTMDNRADFICICLPGMSGKYCQFSNDYLLGAEIGFAPVGAAAVIPTSAKASGALSASAHAQTVATKRKATSPVQAAKAKVQPAQKKLKASGASATTQKAQVLRAPATAQKTPQAPRAAQTVATKSKLASPAQATPAQSDGQAQLQEQLQEYHNLVAKQQQQESQHLTIMTGNSQPRMAPTSQVSTSPQL